MRSDQNTVAEMESLLGQQIRSLRVRQNVSQEALSNGAGISLTAIKNLEQGLGCTTKTLIKTLRYLGRSDWITTLAPQISISPLQLAKRNVPKQRAYSYKKLKADKDV